MDPVTAVDRAYEFIRNKILSGEYPPRKHLTECELAADANMSRTPVREALKRLSAEKYVVALPHRGAFVAERYVEEGVDDIIGLRAVIEAYAAELAAERIGEAELQNLETLADRIDASRSTEEGAGRNALSISLEFHNVICQAARSDALMSVLKLIMDRPLVASSAAFFKEMDWDIAGKTRRELIRALRSRDSRLASVLLSSLVLKTRQVLRESPEAVRDARPRSGSRPMVVP